MMMLFVFRLSKVCAISPYGSHGMDTASRL
jgi:hypothetical protein